MGIESDDDWTRATLGGLGFCLLNTRSTNRDVSKCGEPGVMGHGVFMFRLCQKAISLPERCHGGRESTSFFVLGSPRRERRYEVTFID